MMRFFLLLLLLLVPTHVQATANYHLDVVLIPAEQRLYATAKISLPKTGEEVLNLRLAESCEIVAIHQAGREISYQFKNGQLLLKTTGSEDISISYRGRFSDQVATTPIHNEDPSYGVSASISERGSYLSAAADWYPRPVAQQVQYLVSITTPAGTEAITSGRRIERLTKNGQNRSTWEIDYPLYGLTLAAGPYQVFEDNNGRVPIYAYFYQTSTTLAQVYLKEARDYIQLYEELFGPYPFHKFAIVENFFPTGYGLPSWTLLGSSVIKLPFIVKTSLGHEIAHSWWGTGVRVDYAQGNWAEGLTTYVADYLYKERQSAEEAREYRLKILRDYASLVAPENDFPLAHFSSRNDKASQAIGYGKAAMLFHMLRKQIGEQAFWRGLRKIAEDRMFTQVGWDQFAEVFTETSGINLVGFFKYWLTRPGGPSLVLQNLEVAENNTGWKIRGKIVQESPYYQLPVELQLVTEQGLKHQTVKLTLAEQPFEIESSARPVSLTADPDADLFRILAQEEIPSTINTIRGSQKLLVLEAEQNTPTAETMNILLGAMRKAQIPIKKISKVNPAELAAHDLLIFGMADDLMPAGIVFAETGNKMEIDQQRVELSTHSAVIVQRNPFNPSRSACWFLSQNQQASSVARKVPHYGKYSYLLFAGAKNVLKGITTPSASPLKVEFLLD